MRILIVGNGGREHTLLWKLQRDDPGAEFHATRPNGGMAPHCSAVDIAPDDIVRLADWAETNRMDLTVVGPEAPLAAGIVDRFQARGLPIFGPTAAAARIESSKAYAKDLMTRGGVPTAGHRTFTSASEAESWIRSRGAPIVVKASGLAAGKGAVVCETEAQALEAARSMLSGSGFGEAGHEIVIEEFMEGEELSIFAVANGEDFVTLVPSQDHKRVGEGDTGPNTGGMGAYAPVTIADDATLAEAHDTIIAPTLRMLGEDGAPFRGLLYAGVMKTRSGLRVVEFNCRFGDPETQVVLPLTRTSLLDLLVAVAEGRSPAGAPPTGVYGAAVTTVVASGGYPGAYEKGKPIRIPEDLESENTFVFHAGTTMTGGELRTSGGRVLAVTAVRPSFSEAADASRDAAARIDFEGAFFRRDIGWRERERGAQAATAPSGP